MIGLRPPHRPASPDDAATVVGLVNLAGEGMPLYLWTRSAGAGEAAWELGRMRIRRDREGFSYRNMVVREEDDRIVACLCGYPLQDDPEPVTHDSIPAVVVPLLELEAQVAGTWYVNILATSPGHQGKGFGTQLLEIAEYLANNARMSRMSLITSDTNVGALHLYQRFGFRLHMTAPLVREGWDTAAKNWFLLIKDI